MRPGRRTILAGALGTALLGPVRAAAPRAGGPIAAWGDSLTAGTGASSPQATFPARLAAAFAPPREVFDGGVGGETSAQIRARVEADETHRDWTTVIWAGRNGYGDPDAVMRDIAAMVAHLTSDRFLVLSVLNADTGEERRGAVGHGIIVALNVRLAALYRDRYLDVRRLLITDGLRLAGTVPTARDMRDRAADVPPTSLRADHVHLDGAGYAVVAGAVHDRLVRTGW